MTPDSEQFVRVTWWLRLRLLATAILTLLAVYQEWHFPRGFGKGFPAPIAAALTLTAVAFWISLADVFGRRFAWSGAAIVAVLGASVIALTNLPLGTWNPFIALPPGLAVLFVALLISARWWRRLASAVRSTPRDRN